MLSSIFELKKMALRNLARHKLKTLLTCAAIMVSVTVYIVMHSWLSGMALESRRNIVNYETGAAKIQTALYFEKKDELPSYESFEGWERYADALESAGLNAAPRYTFSGTLYSSDSSAPLMVYAVDPEREKRTMRYTDYIEFGRFIRPGEFTIALGAQTAEKIHVGTPSRISPAELEDLAAQTSDAAFVRSCYEELSVKQQFNETDEHAADRAKRALVLKRGLSKADEARLWELLDDAGRNNVRISTVIDYKMSPSLIDKDKWDALLAPLLSSAEKAVMDAAYEYDELTESFLLKNDEGAETDAALEVMLRAGYGGAVRHVNQVIDAKVIGLVNSPDPANNFNAAYIPLDVLQGEEGMMLEGRVTELLIRGKAMTAADMTSKLETKEALLESLNKNGAPLPPELGVFTWQDYSTEYLGYESLESGSSQILSFLLFFLALIGISNTMLLAILERGKEIGMMRALGMTDGQLTAVFMMEAFFLGCIGAALGIIAGCAVNYPMVKYGLDFSEMLEQMGGSMGYRVSGNFRGTWDIPVIIISGVAASALSALMAFMPVKRALKLQITESLRFE